jgi:NAD(P)-dependent dehydrogenase (short-subunit alcohol dehydrogenase family)
MSERLSGKVALVTGAASGIGKGIATRYASEGARLVVGDIDPAGLDALVAELGPERCAALTADVTSEDDDAALAALAIERFGRLDIAVANAGAGHFAMVVDQDLADWRRVIDLCLTGVFLTVKHAARHMGEGGSIIAIASLNAVQPSAGMSAYCAAKAAVAMFCRVAAMELGPAGVRVNAIAPGLVRTTATGPFWEMPGIVEEFLDNTTVGRFAEPDDVAALAAFLASDESSFCSGSLYPVDGGAATKRYPDLPKAMEGLDQAG